MEIRTTMVRFNISNEQIEKQTDKALLFCFDNDKIWIPLNKLCVTTTYDGTEIIMPKWLYMKTNLPLYTVVSEFCLSQNIDDDEIKSIGNETKC